MPFWLLNKYKTISGPKLLYWKKKIRNLWIFRFLLLAIKLKVKLLSLGTVGWTRGVGLQRRCSRWVRGMVTHVGPEQDARTPEAPPCVSGGVVINNRRDLAAGDPPTPTPKPCSERAGPQGSAKVSEESWRVWGLASPGSRHRLRQPALRLHPDAHHAAPCRLLMLGGCPVGHFQPQRNGGQAGLLLIPGWG